jgi:hypothetical protein
MMVYTKILVLALFISITNLKPTDVYAQKLSNSEFNDIPTTSLDSYNGEWLYNTDSLKFILKFQTYINAYSPILKKNVDNIFGWYSFEKKMKNNRIYEETLSNFKAFDKYARKNISKLNDPKYSNKELPSISAFLSNRGSLQLSFKRYHSLSGTYLNMIGSVSLINKDTFVVQIIPSENYNVNNQMDDVMKYFMQNQIPEKMILHKTN